MYSASRITLLIAKAVANNGSKIWESAQDLHCLVTEYVPYELHYVLQRLHSTQS
jgi:hypothetical protein